MVDDVPPTSTVKYSSVSGEGGGGRILESYRLYNTNMFLYFSSYIKKLQQHSLFSEIKHRLDGGIRC